MKQMMWAALAVSVLFSLFVIAATPDVLVFTDGTRMEVEHFELRGTNVVFATPDGKLQSVPASMVDQPATAEANGISYLGMPIAAAAPPPPPPAIAAQDAEGTITVAAGGSPSAGVDVFAIATLGKQSLGSTNNIGQLPFDPALLTGKVRVTVAVRECPGGVEVYLVSIETDNACREVEDASDEPDCSCEVAGAIWWGSSISVDVTTLVAEGASAPLTQNPLFWGATGGAAAATLIVVASGDDEEATSIPSGSSTTAFTPTSAPPPPVPTPTGAPSNSQTELAGFYNCNLRLVNNPSNHPDLLGNNLVIEVVQQGSNSSVYGNNENFIAVHGPYSNNRQNLRGNGSYAGFPTAAEWVATFTPLEGGHANLQGQYAVGTNGSLPGSGEARWDAACSK